MSFCKMEVVVVMRLLKCIQIYINLYIRVYYYDENIITVTMCTNIYNYIIVYNVEGK